VAQGSCTWEEAFVTKPPAVRTLLQHLGTEGWRAQYGDDVWVRGLDAVARTLVDAHGVARFVIADARFPNELDAVERLGGSLVRVSAPARVATNGMSAEARLHPSETALDHIPDSRFDFVVQNDPDVPVSPVAQLERKFGLLQLQFVLDGSPDPLVAPV
jgi:hypothetical protein